MSKRIALNTPAPDFSLEGIRGETIQLSAFKGKQHVVLIFNRGFQ